MVNTREIALDCVMEILEKKQYSHYVVKQALDKYGYLTKQERSFIKRVTEGTVERCIELDYVLDAFSKIPTRKMKPFIRNLLRMSVYQLLYMDSVPDSAVCDEAVALAAKRSFASLKGFVNGVLRNIARNRESIAYPDPEKEPETYLSVAYSMPTWVVRMWLDRFGREKTERILKALLAERPLTVRLDEGLSDAEKETLLNQMREAGIKTEQTRELPYAYRLQNADRIETIPGFAQGKLAVQDMGSMEIIEMADVKKGQNIIDVCGAPGGKALHAAQKLQGTGFVTVRDLSEKKVELMRETIVRSGCRNIRAEVFDATVPDAESAETADLVLADLPCSGLGAAGRKPDIKYRLQKEDVEALAALQRKILQTVWRYVRPGGKLLYSTCTLTRAENEENAAWFSENFPFEKEKERMFVPGTDPTDGFYAVLFVRK